MHKLIDFFTHIGAMTIMLVLAGSQRGHSDCMSVNDQGRAMSQRIIALQNIALLSSIKFPMRG
jgi:hypothetical protein